MVMIQLKVFFKFCFLLRCLYTLPRIGVPSGGDTKTKTQHQFSSGLMLVIFRIIIWVGMWLTGTGLSNYWLISFHSQKIHKQYL